MNFIKELCTVIARSKITVTFLILFAFSICWYQNDDSLEFKTLLAIFGGLITAYFGLLKQISDDDKMFQQLFTDFNNKYSGETNDLFNKLLSGEKIQIDIKEKLLIIDYFNLCSEEFLWYKKNRIPYKVWKSWEAGIIENISIPEVKEIFNEETNDKKKKNSYYGFVEYIEKKI